MPRATPAGRLRAATRRLVRRPGRRPGPAGGEKAALYRRWLDQRIAARAGRTAPAGIRISLLTCVYAGSPAEFLRQTAGSVQSQTSPDFEWVVLDNGPVGGDIERVVEELARDPRTRLLRAPENLGIIQGLRRCLETAGGEYAMPLDADDLLTADALQQIAAAIAAHGRPPFLYADEDAWQDGSPRDPYFRPAWDPVLNLSSSYIWHPSAFDRATALSLGVFTDPESEYCQDWDTVLRFARAGTTPVHVPEVLYHWRAHGASSTHRPDRVSGSLQSQEHVLELHLASLEVGGRFEVTGFPLDRGLPEPWLRRRHVSPAGLDLLVMADAATEAPAADAAEASPADTTTEAPAADAATEATTADADGFPVRSRLCRAGAAGGATGEAAVDAVRALREAVAASTGDLIAVLGGGARIASGHWAWEATGLLELVPAAGFVAGRLLREDVVVSGELVLDAAGDGRCPDAGRDRTDPGYYALALKPHLCDAFDARFFVARRTALTEALNDLPAAATLPFLGVWLGAWAARRSLLVAWSPLLEAVLPAARDGSERMGVATTPAGQGQTAGAAAAPGRGQTAGAPVMSDEERALLRRWADDGSFGTDGSRWEWRRRCRDLGAG